MKPSMQMKPSIQQSLLQWLESYELALLHGVDLSPISPTLNHSSQPSQKFPPQSHISDQLPLQTSLVDQNHWNVRDFANSICHKPHHFTLAYVSSIRDEIYDTSRKIEDKYDDEDQPEVEDLQMCWLAGFPWSAGYLDQKVDKQDVHNIQEAISVRAVIQRNIVTIVNQIGLKDHIKSDTLVTIAGISLFSPAVTLNFVCDIFLKQKERHIQLIQLLQAIDGVFLYEYRKFPKDELMPLFCHWFESILTRLTKEPALKDALIVLVEKILERIYSCSPHDILMSVLRMYARHKNNSQCQETLIHIMELILPFLSRPSPRKVFDEMNHESRCETQENLMKDLIAEILAMERLKVSDKQLFSSLSILNGLTKLGIVKTKMDIMTPFEDPLRDFSWLMDIRCHFNLGLIMESRDFSNLLENNIFGLIKNNSDIDSLVQNMIIFLLISSIHQGLGRIVLKTAAFRQFEVALSRLNLVDTDRATILLVALGRSQPFLIEDEHRCMTDGILTELIKSGYCIVDTTDILKGASEHANVDVLSYQKSLRIELRAFALSLFLKNEMKDESKLRYLRQVPLHISKGLERIEKDRDVVAYDALDGLIYIVMGSMLTWVKTFKLTKEEGGRTEKGDEEILSSYKLRAIYHQLCMEPLMAILAQLLNEVKKGGNEVIKTATSDLLKDGQRLGYMSSEVYGAISQNLM